MGALQNTALAILSSIHRDPVRWLVSALGLVLLFFLGWRAAGFVHDYDGAAFHLPYAARVIGLCGDDCLQLMGNLQHRFEHIPKFGHFLFGGAWWLTGTASAVGMVNFLALVLLIGYLAWVFRVHWGLAAIALIAVPFVRIEAVALSTDLLPSVLLVLGLLTVLDYILNPDRFSRSRAVFGLLMLAAASATKLQVYPMAIMGVMIFAMVVFWRHYKQVPDVLAFSPHKSSRAFAVMALVAALAFTSSWQIRNAAVYGNPLYPVSVTVFGHELSGRFSDRVSLAEPHVDHHPLVRWAASVFEYRAYDHRHTPWTKAQGNVPRDAWSFRIGGFNGVYVMLLMLFTGYLLCYRIEREQRWKVGLFLGFFTLVYMFLPASYYLRYNIWWMLLLVGVALIITADGFRGLRDRNTDALPLFRGMVIACCLASLLASGFRFITPSGFSSVENYVSARRIDNTVRQFGGADSVMCVRVRDAVYYARIFHEGAQHLTVQLHPRDLGRTDDDLRARFGCTHVVR